MKSKVFKSLLAIACLLSSTSVSAYDFEVDGIYYNVVSITDFTCEVSTGSDKYEGDYKGNVVIPETVNYANRTLTVVSIGSAFKNCISLTSVTIPNSVTEIGYKAFYNCFSLTSVTIPNSVTEIGNSAFQYCSSLTSVTIPNSVTTIDDYAFYDCSRLASVTIPNSVTTIGWMAFRGCRSLTSVTIPNSVTKIDYAAFSGCSSLTSVTIPSSVKVIDDDTFYGCSSLTSVTIPNSVTTIGNWAFGRCSQLSYVKIEDGETTLSLKEVSFSSNRGNFFLDCPITTLYVGRNLSYNDYDYKESPFANNKYIKNLTIGSFVTTISNYAFYNCSELTELYCLNSTPPSIGSNNFTNNQYMTLNVYVPQEALETYQSADTWKNFWQLQGFDATGIENVKPAGKEDKAVYYDLTGRRLDAPRHGLNIVNGKKVIKQ